MSDLSTRDIKFLPGVGPKKAELFNKELKIFSFEDLLYYFPYKYIDRSRTYKIKEIDGNMPYIQLRGEILNFETQGEGKGRRLIARFSDGTGIIELVWFKGIKFIIEKYKPGIEYTLFGKPTRFGSKFNIAHPEIDPIDDIIDKAPGLQAYYSTTEKMKSHFLNSKAIQKIMYNLWKSINGPLPETLPAQVIARSQVIYLTEAIQNIHFPQSPDLLRKAQFRLNSKNCSTCN